METTVPILHVLAFFLLSGAAFCEERLDIRIIREDVQSVMTAMVSDG
jgi:hypothetical protein